MNFTQLVKTRYSVRSFSDRKIEEDKLNTILEAGRVAPTACNNQPQKIYVLQSEEAIEKLKSASRFVFGAKTVLLIAADKDREWKNPFSEKYRTGEIDCSIVCTHMMLQAWELGIGSCWIGYYDPDAIAKLFDLPSNERVIALLPLGYPSEDSVPAAGHSSFRPIDDTVKYL